MSHLRRYCYVRADLHNLDDIRFYSNVICISSEQVQADYGDPNSDEAWLDAAYALGADTLPDPAPDTAWNDTVVRV